MAKFKSQNIENRIMAKWLNVGFIKGFFVNNSHIFQYFGKQIFVWSSVIKGASFDLQHGYNCFGFLPLYAIAKNFAVKMTKQDLT